MVVVNVLKGGGALLRNYGGCGGGGRPLLLPRRGSLSCSSQIKWNGARVGKWKMVMGFARPLSPSPFSTSLRNCKCSTSTASSSSSSTEEASVDSSSSSPSPSLSSSTVDMEVIKDAANTLDIRVGCIVKAWRHEEADSLYVEEVDIGEPEPRIICSGLVKYVPIDHLQDRKVVVLANLKPRNMRGVKSSGMLMAASDASHENVELLVPPEDSPPGERIWFGSAEEKESLPDAASPNQIQKKKIWELVQPHLKTDTSCVAALGEHIMRSSAGVVVTTSLENANIS